MKIEIGTYKITRVNKFTAAEKVVAFSWALLVSGFVANGIEGMVSVAIAAVGAAMIIGPINSSEYVQG